MLKELSISRGRDACPLQLPRRRLHGQALPDFDVRAVVFKLRLESYSTHIDGPRLRASCSGRSPSVATTSPLGRAQSTYLLGHAPR